MHPTPPFPLAAALAAVLLIPIGWAARAADRAALVIGIDAYPTIPLQNAVRDATAVRDMLKNDLGFPESGIVFATDTDRIAFYEQFEAFKKTAAAADIVLFYYAGHGMESLDGKENFLIPRDADVARAVESEAALRATGINLMSLTADLAAATRGAKIVLMDCCRERPAGRGVTARAGGGLVTYADDRIPADTLMILAAAPEKAASDGGQHGPFTAALLEVLPRGGRNLMDAFFAVSDRVQEATARQQVPWLKFDGSGKIFRQQAFLASVNPNVPLPKPPSPIPMPAEGGDAVEGKRAGEVRSFGGIELVWCPAGEFQMGSPVAEEGRFDDERQHRVKLTRGFWLGKTEVTQGQWEAVMGTSVGEQRDKADKSWDLRGEGPHYPMYYVSWEEAEAFCEKLNREAGVGSGWKWTLPSEAQWEYGCRAGTSGPYAGGDLGELGWYRENAGGTTHEVGRKGANGWGLQDMHGNVWEWCLDGYGDYETGSVSDPLGADGGSYRVYRGGSWNYVARDCRSAFRDWDSPSIRNDFLGFRVALSSTR